MPSENQIVEVRLTLADDRWVVQVKKDFAPEYGGGSEIFTEDGGTQIHRALDVARGMVTFSPGQRSGS